MFLHAWLRRVTHSTVWSASFLFLLPLLLTASVTFNPVLVKDIKPEGDSWPDFLTSAGDAVYFYANTGQVQQFFVANDSGATQLTSLPNGTGCIFVEENDWPIVISDAVYFSVTTDPNCSGGQVWRTDGSVAGTKPAADSPTGFSSLRAADIGFYALGGDGSGSGGVWYSDGSPAGTQLVQGGFSFTSTYIYAADVLDNNFYFLVQQVEEPSYELWRADSTGAAKLATISLGYYTGSEIYRDSLYLYGSSGEVWRTAAGSDTPVLWQDGSKFHGRISRMYAVGDRLYLIDWDTSRPMMDWTETLWRYDGAADKLDEIVTYSAISSPVSMGDSAYFAGRQWTGPPLEGSVLLRLPLASTTPTPVSPEFALTGDKEIGRIVADDAASGGLLYMRVSGPAGWEVWASDGSAEGTQRAAGITDSLNNWGSAACPCLAVADGTLYFDRKDAATGVEPWKLQQVTGQSLYLPHIVH